MALPTSSLSKEAYSYDELGRLTEVQETPTGKDCTARLYNYDEDGNRTSLTSRESSSEKCSTEGGSTQSYAYDTADRLVEPGVSYEPFGNTTTLPAADAGGTTLSSTYYVNNTLASQEQNGEKISYNLDPTGRIRETISTGTTNSTVTSHYAGPEGSPAWTITSGGTWTRNITGINGGLAAIQTNGKTPVLQLPNLHGDIIATALDSETESKLVAASETTEYGVPRTTVTEKYSWLGADKVPTELPSGVINMGARVYIPELGRFEQTDPQPGGSINAYAYTDDDPVNEADPTGETATYNYEAAEGGAAAAGVPEAYGAPGAIKPPPANLQAEAEFAAHPPWDAVYTFSLTFGGGGKADTASLIPKWLKKAAKEVESTVGGVIEEAGQSVALKAEKIADFVTSPFFETAFACVNGADEISGALDGEEWKDYPTFTLSFTLIGCAMGIEGTDEDGHIGHFTPIGVKG